MAGAQLIDHPIARSESSYRSVGGHDILALARFDAASKYQSYAAAMNLANGEWRVTERVCR
jgi:hypothetical protein